MEQNNNAVLLGQAVSTKDIFISIAIPHYKHRKYLEIALASLAEQVYDNFEILISDDNSPDDAYDVIPQYLESIGRPFRYYRQNQNLGYDGNIRFCLNSANGEYVFLLGNDDALSGPFVLENIAEELKKLRPMVAFTSYSDFGSGAIHNRAQATKNLGSGVDVAIKVFRAFSFVSGLIFKKSEAVRNDTNKWDKSIYYQFYLAGQIIGGGGTVASLKINAVRQYIRINGETAPGTKPWVNVEWSFKPRYTGLDSVIRVTADSILPQAQTKDQSKILRDIFKQIYSISYPIALIYYRKTANWSFAVGVARRMYPDVLFAEYKYPYLDAMYPKYNIKLNHRLEIWALYFVVTLTALAVPLSTFEKYRERLANLVQKHQQTIR
jgi:glycosyltransferase involved in cell wall biosynthesis